MRRFLIQTVVVALAFWVAAKLIPGVWIGGPGTLVLAAVLWGLVNAIVRPIMVVLTVPLTIVTLGLFLFVVNATMFALVAWFLDRFTVSGFWAALFGAITVSIVSAMISWIVKPEQR